MVPMSRRHLRHNSPTHGFTLLELMVTAAVLVLVSTVSFPSLVRFYETEKLRQAAIELQSHLLRGRTLAQRLQTTCTLAISSGASGATVLVSGSGACANLSPLNLSNEVNARDLCISNADGGPASCSAPSQITFLPLGVLVGAPQTLYLSGTATSSQSCVDLSLTQIRVGFRNASSGACTFSRS